MHDTASISGQAFSLAYTKNMNKNHLVYDIGGVDYNGSLKSFFQHMIYKCIDIESGNGVDYVIDPTKPYPFLDNSVDVVVSSSCFEHDPCFWITFKEMCRILKPGGYIYISAPCNEPYHKYPGDNWRFYPDAAQSLAYWSNREYNGKIDRVTLEETFRILPLNDVWIDFVAVFRKMDQLTTEFVTPNSIIDKIGPMKQLCIDAGLRCVWY
jgi:SAM-dependent methyltransferase